MLAAALALPLFAASALAATTCNGHASLCDQKYSNVTYIGTHNSYSVGVGPANNQYVDVTAQLNDGVRALQVQAHSLNDTIQLCHSSCSLQNGGSLQDYLGKVSEWMNANPNDVVTMVIVNIENLPVSQYAGIFLAAGLDKKAYKPSSAVTTVSSWPTLGSMIDAGTNLVVFIDNQAKFEEVPYLIDEFTNMWEDAYDVTEPTFACAVNRTKGDSTSQMYMINHFLDQQFNVLGLQTLIPNMDKLNVTNAATGDGSITYHVDNCMMLHGARPNIILLDYYNAAGSAPFDVAAQLNGVPAPENKMLPYTQTANLPAGTGGNGGAAQTGAPDARISTANIPGGSARGSTAGVVLTVAAAALALAI